MKVLLSVYKSCTHFLGGQVIGIVLGKVIIMAVLYSLFLNVKLSSFYFGVKWSCVFAYKSQFIKVLFIFVSV